MIQKSQIKLAECARGPACFWWQCWGAPEWCAPMTQAATRAQALEMLRSCSMIQKSQIKLAK